MPATPSAQDGDGSQQTQIAAADEQHLCAVSDQITDCVALTNVATLGAG